MAQLMGNDRIQFCSSEILTKLSVKPTLRRDAKSIRQITSSRRNDVDALDLCSNPLREMHDTVEQCTGFYSAQFQSLRGAEPYSSDESRYSSYRKP
jgi:hypothetical protein